MTGLSNQNKHFSLWYLFDFLNIVLQFKDHKSKDGTEKSCLSPTVLKSQKKMKLPDTAGTEMKTTTT